MGITHVKVSTIADGSTTEHIRPSDWNADHTINGTVTLSSGVASSAPLLFVAGTNLTTPAAGAAEYDGTCFYLTQVSSARHISDMHQLMTINATYSLSTAAATPQKMFNGTTNGALNIAGNRTYAYECQFSVTGLSTLTHTVGFGFGGTASITRNAYTGISKQAAASTAGAANIMFSTLAAPSTTAAGALSPTSTQPSIIARVEGKIVIDTSGTLIPQLVQSAGTVAAVVGADSYFRIWPLGSSAITNVGHWS